MPQQERLIEIRTLIRTNMTREELTQLGHGLAITVREFGKEHLGMPRYDEATLKVVGFNVEEHLVGPVYSV